MAFCISIANEKGGVAKTTTTLSLGAALLEMNQRVLLVDLDSQSNLSLALAVDVAKSNRSVVKVLLEASSASSMILPTGLNGMDILPATSDLATAERFLPIRQGYEMILRKALRSQALPYDYILMDCPPFLGAVTVNGLMASDLLVMPTQAEFFSINALKDMMSLIRRIRAQGNPNLTYRLLVTMFDRRNKIHRTLFDQLQTTFGAGVLQSRIEIDTRLRESPIAGLPIIFHAPKSRSAIQYRELAQEITAYVQENRR